MYTLWNQENASKNQDIIIGDMKKHLKEQRYEESVVAEALCERQNNILRVVPEELSINKIKKGRSKHGKSKE